MIVPNHKSSTRHAYCCPGYLYSHVTPMMKIPFKIIVIVIYCARYVVTLHYFHFHFIYYVQILVETIIFRDIWWEMIHLLYNYSSLKLFISKWSAKLEIVKNGMHRFALMCSKVRATRFHIQFKSPISISILMLVIWIWIGAHVDWFSSNFTYWVIFTRTFFEIATKSHDYVCHSI